MLLTNTVMIKWYPRNKNWYKNKGYIFTKMEGEFEVKIKDLPNTSRVLISVKCDSCNKIFTDAKWLDYKKCVKEDGKYYCHKCANAGFKKWTSFYDWCYEHLPKADADKLLARWDHILNKLNVKEISFSSHGIKGRGYWFKCLEHPEHGSELKDIHNFVRNRFEASINCKQCNSISITHPHLVKYLVDKEDALKYSKGSNEKLPMKCPNCGYKNKKSINSLIMQGYGCVMCSDGIPYPEKFISSILYHLDITLCHQLSKTTFKWCNKYKYDFYIGKINCIIETHGLQHYEETTGHWDSLLKTQENDKNKAQLAKENGIDNYVVIDCRYSKMEFIKSNIMNSILPSLLNFEESDIDWLKCHEYACKSLVKVACDLWKDNHSITSIGKILKLNINTIAKYLKQGEELQWCNYIPKEISRKQIICLTTNKIFNSQVEAGIYYDILSTNISMCCNNKRVSAGKHPDTGEKLVWEYHK